MRTEKDFLGEIKIPTTALYGIHAARAADNFPNKDLFHIEWYEAAGKVKQACYETVLMFREAVEKEHPDLLPQLRIPEEKQLEVMIAAAKEVCIGEHFSHFIIPAVQGGAGTSINMNINEIITNRALQLLGKAPGDYTVIDPVEAANIYQSTNDVIPTSLTVAVMELLKKLEEAVNATRLQTENLESKYRNSIRLCYTQLQEAVPGTYGQLFSNFSDAFSRDWWRVSKASERIKQVNIGGGATGTGVSFPRFYIMEVGNQLRRITGLPLAQGENLADSTSNMDSLVEVHAILKAHAVNMEKFASDLRLLAAGVRGEKEVLLPEKQSGSSIMPGKVNPVIPEFVISSAHQVYANDQLITGLAGQGQLDLNAYLPSIGNALLSSLKLLISINHTSREHLLKGLEIDETVAASRLFRSPAVTTALSPLIGYNKSGELARTMKKENIDIFEANDRLELLPAEKLKKIMQPEYLLKKGFSMKDVRDLQEE
ncbi:MAG: lyase family protein [Bacteroidales bacterium]|nr:lyase family protein [Bacteroidales bacterium]MDT8429907.1 lyase family protein [Bacteroidales bacterium]